MAAPRDVGSDEDQTKIGAIPQSSKGTRRDRAHLIVLAGDSLGKMFVLGHSALVVGRTVDADIRLQDDNVSRRHARIVRAQGEVCLEDLGSANGTFLNGHRIRNAVLRDGDKIQMGSTTIIKFAYADELEERFQRTMYDAALHDGMTKAFNKGHFLHRLESEVAYAKRHGTPLSLLMLDVDHFKRINDLHGHPAGDNVLATLADVARGAIRTEDLFARYGGEEFAVLCRNTTIQRALVLAERLRAKVETFLFEESRQRIPVTISVGAASWFDQPDSATQLISGADAALYEAKAGGRNCVAVHRA